jgi:hypothetical protein
MKGLKARTSRHLGKILSPLQGLIFFERLTQGGARFNSLALGYHLPGFPPSSDYGATSQPF